MTHQPITTTPAKTAAHIIHYAFELYRQYCMDNNLDDDSKSLTVKELIEFYNSELLDSEIK